MSSTQFDVIVVGAGPGGASAAHDLAKAGARVLLLEKAKLPRHKTCGGGVTYKAAQALPFDISSVVERTINTVVFSYKLARPAELRSEQPLVYMVRRNQFDNFLTAHAVSAGARLMDETKVDSLEVDEHGATVRTHTGVFTSSWLIGADGATGTVARALGLMQDRILMPALEEEVEVSDKVAEYWRDKMGLDLGSLSASYGWVFPKGDHLNVGVGTLLPRHDNAKKLREYDVEHVSQRLPSQIRIRKRFGYVLPTRRPGSAIHKGRAMLVGDAAGLVESFTGEGIYWAVRSGQIAAKTIVHGDKPSDYELLVDREIMTELVSARRWLNLYAGMPYACYVLPRKWPMLWRAICGIIRGDRKYSDIRKRLGILGFVEELLPI